MVRDDYRAQLERHAGHWDVLPDGLVVPSLPHGSEWHRGRCRGIALLTDQILAGNRWPAVSGALLAELSRRCAMLGALTAIPFDRWPREEEIEVRFRRAIRVADPRRHPSVADGRRVLYWSSIVEAGGEEGRVSVTVRLTREPPAADAESTVEARMVLAMIDIDAEDCGVERRMSEYLLSLPRRMALPAYLPDWKEDEIHGVCREKPGSLLAAAEQALADAGKIIRGDGVAEDQEESMLLGDMTYRWRDEVDEADAAGATYVARPGSRRRDEKGRDWVRATAILGVGERTVGEATGNLVLRRFPATSS